MEVDEPDEEIVGAFPSLSFVEGWDEEVIAAFPCSDSEESMEIDGEELPLDPLPISGAIRGENIVAPVPAMGDAGLSVHFWRALKNTPFELLAEVYRSGEEGEVYSSDEEDELVEVLLQYGKEITSKESEDKFLSGLIVEMVENVIV